MTSKHAIERLKQLRAEQAVIAKEIKKLREFLQEKGINPDTKPDYSDRNTRIYREWQKGQTFIEVAAKFNLSVTRVSGICRRIEKHS